MLDRNKFGEEIISADPEMHIHHNEFYKRNPLARQLTGSPLRRITLVHVLVGILLIGIGATYVVQKLVGPGHGVGTGVGPAEGWGQTRERPLLLEESRQSRQDLEARR